MDRILLWVAVALLTVGFLMNSYLLSEVRENSVCVVDLVAVTSELVNTINYENFTREHADRIMSQLKQYMKPERFGCSYIFLKGALIDGKNLVDITPQVRSYVQQIRIQQP